MEYSRTELLPGIFLTHLRSDKFKTACMSLTLLTQLQRETASMNALIPYVLRRGTTQYGDMEALSRRMDELYGTAIEPVVRRVGEIQCIGFYGSFPEDAFLPKGEKLLPSAIGLMADLLLSPNTRGGLLLPQYVDSEREKLLERIRSRVNDKRSYSLTRCFEEMCCFEDFAVSRLGSEEAAESINYKKLTRHYRELLQSCPIELFYCGRASVQQVSGTFIEALASMPRGEINYDLGTDIRMNAVEAQPRYVEEKMDVTQGKLVIGFRLGECMEDPDAAAVHVFNSVYGSGSTSKLFMNVREKLSLCYYASSISYLHKGLLMVASGIEFDKFEAARDEIFAQLEAIKEGDISDEEFTAAKRGVASDLRSLMDSQGELEGFYLSQTLDGLDYGPMELAELVEDVTKEDIIRIAQGIECDMIYFLRGLDEDDTEEADNAEP